MMYDITLDILRKEFPEHKFKIKKGPVLVMDGVELPLICDFNDRVMQDLINIQLMHPLFSIARVLIEYLVRQIKAKVHGEGMIKS